MVPTYTERLEKMFRAEFGERGEVRLRLAVLFMATSALTLATRDIVFPVWTALYFTAVATFWLYARWWLGSGSTNRIAFYIAVVLHSATLAVFLYLPVYMIQSQSTLMIFGGICALIGFVIYVMQREDPGADVLQIEALGFSCALAMILLSMVSRFNTPLSLFGANLVAISLFLYFMRAAQLQRLSFLARREAELRYARAQKARALGQFVGGVAHDFNNQLTAIMGNLELFEVLDDPQERKTALRQSKEAAERAALTVKQLLASSGRTRLSPDLIPVETFFASIEPVICDLLPQQISLTLEPPDEESRMYVDRDSLETCIIQLCLNAQDALNGVGTISITATRLEKSVKIDPPIESPGPHVMINVIDNGPGVAAEILPQMAEPFFTTKDVGEGSGLGLSAVSGFARQSRGAMVMSSAPGQGLKVALVLPTAPHQH